MILFRAGGSSRLVLLSWIVIWTLCVVLLIVFWKQLPAYVSWPLAALEALFAPDFKTALQIIRGKQRRKSQTRFDPTSP